MATDEEVKGEVAVTEDRKQSPAQVAASTRDTYLWHSQAQMGRVRHTERKIVRGERAYVWDDEGRRLLDAPASLWYCNIGHARAEIAEAVAEQMAKIETYSTFQSYANDPALELAARIARLVPIDNPRVFLTSGGSDAVDVAAKLARRYWQLQGRSEKTGIVTRELAYHGLHAFGTSIAGIGFNRAGYGDLVPNTTRVPTNDAEAFERLASERGEEIAAFFCEPVIGTGGVIPPAEGYLERVAEICRAHEILFVVDEVITGFGRTGSMFAAERYGLTPDILLMAKGITSGYLPLGAAAFAERLWEPFWAQDGELIFHHGLTYAGHASCCAAALANLDILEREHLVSRVAELEGELVTALSAFEDHPAVEEIRSGVGLLAGVQLADPSCAERACEAAIERGVLMRTLTAGTLHVSPPFVIDHEDLTLLADGVGAALEAADDCSPTHTLDT